MTAESWAWCMGAYAVVVTVLLVIVLGAVDDMLAELHQLRRRIHPSTRNRKATR